MKIQTGYKNKLLVSFILLSMTGHIIAGFELLNYGGYTFTRPIDSGQYIKVELREAAAVTSIEQKQVTTVAPPKRRIVSVTAEAAVTATKEIAAAPVQLPADISLKQTKNETQFSEDQLLAVTGAPVQQAAFSSPHKKFPETLPPIRTAAEFLTARQEKLVYAISIYGIRVGSAVLTAVNRDGELKITTEARSNAVISSVYPVENATETRLFSGRYITTTIRQQEGSYRSDKGFTLLLPEKQVFWADRLNRRYVYHQVDDDNLLDIVTGFYFLRKQQLEVGSTVILHLFDSNTYVLTPVHILRRERINLPGRNEVATLVIKPELKTDGIFQRRGELLIWLTDDDNKTPVRMETGIAIGRVTAELISAEVIR